MKLLLFCGGVAMCLLVAHSAEIQIRGEPALPVANLVQNPGAEESGANGIPAHWQFSTARPDLFEETWADNGRSGKCLGLKASSGEMSGYWGQTVPVTPGETYVFKGFFRLAAGKILCYAHSRLKLPDGRGVAVDERLYRGTKRGHWLIPVFLPAESLGGPSPDEWHPFSLTVTVPEPLSEIRFSLGMYFTPGEAWFDDLWVGPATTDLTVTVRAGDGESLRRVRVFREDEDKPVLDSGVLDEGTDHFEKQLDDQAADARYRVVAETADGISRTVEYPDAEGAER